MAGGRVVSVLVPLCVGVLLVGGFIFLFLSWAWLGLFVFLSGGGGGQWGAGIFLAAGGKFFGVYTPHPCPLQSANPILLYQPISTFRKALKNSNHNNHRR